MGGNVKSDLSKSPADRQLFIGGSDARIIMGGDEEAIVRLWREKRGEAEPKDLSGNLVVQLGTATEELNRTGTSAIQVAASQRSKVASSTPRSPGWWRPWTVSWKKLEPSSRPNSCYPGRFQ